MPTPGDQVAQPLQRRPHQGGAGVALVFEHPVVGDVKPQLLGVRAQRRGLRRDRLVLLLSGRRHPGVNRRAGHAAVVLPDRPAERGPAVVAPRWRRPPTNPWPRGGRTRTASRPPGPSPAPRAPVAPVAPRQELGQRLHHQGGDRAPRLPSPLPHTRTASAAGSRTVNTVVASGTTDGPSWAAR